jgi:hypothetical protein
MTKEEEKIQENTQFLCSLVESIKKNGSNFSFNAFCKANSVKSISVMAKAAVATGIVSKKGTTSGTVWFANLGSHQIQPIHGRLFAERLSAAMKEKSEYVKKRKAVAKVNKKYFLSESSIVEIIEELSKRGFTGEIEELINEQVFTKKVKYKF